MHTNAVTRRRFLALSGAVAAGGLLARPALRACPIVGDADPMKGVATAVNALAADLHRELSRKEKNTLFLSPFSISAALAMTSAGARGTTLDEMRKTLHLPADPHDGFGALIKHLNAADGTKIGMRPFQLSVANAIWAQKDYPWRKEFADLTRAHYGAGLVETDFAESEAARKQINDWVEKETRQKIKDLIGPGVLTPLTRMVLANAIHFKGNWAYKFDPRATKEAPFTRPDGSKADVPLMRQTGEFGYGEFTMFVRRSGEKVQVLELPYVGKELSMVVFLPEDPTGVHRLPQWLGGGDFAAEYLKPRGVAVALPRFKAESKLSLKPTLIDLGMKAAFGGADFTGLAPAPHGNNLFISHVLHKAFVDVNEEGTEAAGATGVAVAERVAEVPVVFRADRPFAFAVRDTKSGAVLFLGRYCGPAA